MFEQQNLLPPPWMALPEIERGSIHWRMGVGEAYLERFVPWYRSLTAEEKQAYLRLFPEPLMWQGYITGEPECDCLHDGDLYVTLWRKNGQPRYSVPSLVSARQAGDMQALYMFWGHQPARDGRLSRSCFSQWWQSDFFHDGERFCCMEQCMMLGKAKLFQDREAMEKIRASTDPRDIKALGRAVRGFDSKRWDAVKYSLILTGNYHKFTQNAALRRFLLDTGDSVLVEASPYDTIWGIGLSAEDPRAQDPRQWRGSNLLGFALMEVRDEIRRTYANEARCCDPWA